MVLRVNQFLDRQGRLQPALEMKMREWLDRAVKQVASCMNAVAEWESALLDIFPVEGGATGESGDSVVRYERESRNPRDWEPIEEAGGRLITELAKVAGPMKHVADALETWSDKGASGAKEVAKSLMARLDELNTCAADLGFLVAGDSEGDVCWASRTGWGRKQRVSLHAAPISVAERMRLLLFDRFRSCVLSSATLTSRDSFAFLGGRMGWGRREDEPVDRYRTLQLGSPFDLRRQCRLFIPSWMPEPGHRDFPESFHAMVDGLVRVTQGRALVLFTSIQAMRQAATALTDDLADAGITTLVQGRDGSRDELIARLRSGRTNCVVFGVASFWEGVDVPGDALQLLVIAKLPFPAFREPVWEARREWVEAQGQSAFMHLDVPTAVLKLRQGFGRLIRSGSDRGICVLADRRLLTKRYGRQFLKSLPVPAEPTKDMLHLEQAASDFLTGLNEQKVYDDPQADDAESWF